MLFSIIIPARNEEKDIGDCLKSITDKEYEVIVVNDGSIDNTEKIAKGYGAKVVSFKDGHSASFSRNRGAEVAKGDYLIFVDADMVLPKNFVKKIKSYLPFDCLTYRVLSYKPKTIFQRAWFAYRKKMEKPGAEGCFHCMSKKIFNLVGGFDETIFYFEDFDMKNRILELNPKYKISDIIVRHKEVETFGDFRRQRKWHGKGIYTSIKKKKKLSPLKYFLPCLFLPILPFYLFLYWLFYWKETKDPMNSFFWITLDFFGRFVSLFYFLKEIFS